MNFLQNISANLQTKGPVAIVCVWLIAFAIIAVVGRNNIARDAMLGLGGFMAVFLLILGNRHNPKDS